MYHYPATTPAARELDTISDELELLKIKLHWLSLPSLRKQPDKSIVARTAGVLGKEFPSGILFENEIRRAWKGRLLREGV